MFNRGRLAAALLYPRPGGDISALPGSNPRWPDDPNRGLNPRGGYILERVAGGASRLNEDQIAESGARPGRSRVWNVLQVLMHRSRRMRSRETVAPMTEQ